MFVTVTVWGIPPRYRPKTCFIRSMRVALLMSPKEVDFTSRCTSESKACGVVVVVVVVVKIIGVVVVDVVASCVVASGKVVVVVDGITVETLVVISGGFSVFGAEVVVGARVMVVGAEVVVVVDSVVVV